MNTSRVFEGWGPAAVLGLALGLGGGCNLVEADVWNLRQVHDEDGSARRYGNVRNDFEFFFSKTLDALQFEDPQFLKGLEKQIDDPLGVCLEALNGLKHGDSDDPRILAMQVEMFAWLAADDTYVLSRERCALQLGPLGRLLDVEGPLPEEDEPASPAQVAGALTELIRAVRPYLTGENLTRADALQVACAKVRDLPMNLDGARRALRAVGALMEVGEFDRPGLEPLVELVRDLERRCIAFAMQSVLDDPSPIVRAAAVQAGVVMTNNGSPGLLQSALSDRSEDVRLRAVRLLIELGLPTPTEELSPEEYAAYETAWIQLLIEALQASIDGPVSVALCQALARITDAPFVDLRPELWSEWWAEESRMREAGKPAAADSGP